MATAPIMTHSHMALQQTVVMAIAGQWKLFLSFESLKVCPALELELIPPLNLLLPWVKIISSKKNCREFMWQPEQQCKRAKSEASTDRVSD